MFKRNKHFWRRYCKFIHYCKNRKLPEGIYTESHHILPRCLYKHLSKERKAFLDDDEDNRVIMTAREHFIAHWMLTKCFQHERFKNLLAHAFSCFLKKSSKNSGRLFTSRQFEVLKKYGSIANKGKGNPAYGKRRSYEARKKTSETLKVTNQLPEVRKRRSEAAKGSNNGMWGKKQSLESVNKNSYSNKIGYSLYAINNRICRCSKKPLKDKTLVKHYDFVFKELVTIYEKLILKKCLIYNK